MLTSATSLKTDPTRVLSQGDIPVEQIGPLLGSGVGRSMLPIRANQQMELPDRSPTPADKEGSLQRQH